MGLFTKPQNKVVVTPEWARKYEAAGPPPPSRYAHGHGYATPVTKPRVRRRLSSFRDPHPFDGLTPSRGIVQASSSASSSSYASSSSSTFSYSPPSQAPRSISFGQPRRTSADPFADPAPPKKTTNNGSRTNNVGAFTERWEQL